MMTFGDRQVFSQHDRDHQCDIQTDEHTDRQAVIARRVPYVYCLSEYIGAVDVVLL